MIGRLSSGQTALDLTYLSQIRTAQNSVEEADPRTGIIDTDSFGIKSDNLHFDGSGQQSMGAEFARGVAYYSWILGEFTSEEIDAGNAEPDADPDNDGETNYAEFLGSSAPKDATSQFKAWITLPTDDSAQISYTSSPFRSYSVERYEAASGKWLELLPYKTGSVGEQSRVIELALTSAMFRVRSDLP